MALDDIFGILILGHVTKMSINFVSRRIKEFTYKFAFLGARMRP